MYIEEEEEEGALLPPTRRMQWMWQSVMSYEIKNNELVRGKFS